MVGLFILIGLAVYIGLAYFCVTKTKSKRGKIIVTLVFILVPTADVIVGRLYFAYLCHTQAGQFIYKTIEVGDDYIYKPGEMMKHKLDETGEKLAIAEGGEINRKELRKRYDFSLSKKEGYSKIFHIAKRQRVIEDKESEEVLSKSISFLYYGGWVENLYPYGNPRYCSKNHKPISKQNIHARLFDETFLSESNSN